jgi:sulfotransferase
MDKKYYFLAGLHRSGNTLLSSILNQNPDIYSSPLSPVSEYMWQCHLAKSNLEQAKTNPYTNRSDNVVSSIIKNYYEDVEKPIIFDRDKNWAHPANINMLKTYLHDKPKIVFTTRPIIEVLASYIAIGKNFLMDTMNSSGYIYNPKLQTNENLCDYLMSDSSNLFNLLHFLKSVDNPENDKVIHIVKYEDLLSSPQETMNDIYGFLEMEEFKHNFKNIKKIETYNEGAAGLPKDLHKIRKTLGRSDIKVEDYLTPYSIEKYKDARYF